MPKCPHCSKGIRLTHKCTICNTTWCNNGQCTGTAGKKQHSRSPNALCQTCRKKGVQKI